MDLLACVKRDSASVGKTVTPSMPAADKPWISLKDLFWAVYLWPGRWLGRILPVSVLRNADKWFLPLARCLSGPVWRRFPRQLSRYPALMRAAGDLRALFEAHFANALQRSADDLLMELLPAESVVAQYEIRGREHLEKAFALNRGVLLVSGHFLANRLAKRFMKTQGWPVMSVRNLGFDDPFTGRWGARHLQRRYYEFLHRIIGDEVDLHDRDCSLKILERLRRGGIVNLHNDLAVSQKRVELPFLGMRNRFAVGFLDIARIAGCPIVPMLCLGNNRRLTIEFHSPFYADSRSPAGSAEALAGIFESQILQHPQEWEFTMQL
ncbi:MAG: lysophospholipid acyltransferase family protein [Verrucomicrobia bacterium]|nr:lysophospholipid acyltransferase family protein [Verrucomicrobiota bacterium]